MKYDYVIIGNSAGGIGCVESIREADMDGKISIISDEEYHTYSRALLPYYLSEKIDQEKIYYRPIDFYEKRDIRLILKKKVVKLDPEEKKVFLDDGQEFFYEKLLIATGGQPSLPKIAGGEKNTIFTFNTLKDVLKIKTKIETSPVKRAVVLGGGLIGLMAAEALKKNGLDVSVVESMDRVLAPVIDETASRMVETHLGNNGIHIIKGHTIKKISDDGNGAILDDETELPCKMLIISIGVRPRVDIVEGTKIKVNRGIVVDRRMRTSVEDVYACGDCAEVYDSIYDDFRLIPLWPTAYTGGIVAGFNMSGIAKEYEWCTSMNSMHFFGLPVITAGLSTKSERDGYEILSVLNEDDQSYRKIVIKDDHLVGMILMNRIDRAGILLGLMKKRVDVSSFKEDLLNDDFGLINLPEVIREGIIW